MAQVEEAFDFVVIGSGDGAFAAALVAKTHGLSVLVLEKTNLFGGTTAKSGGVLWTSANRFMAEDGVEDSTEQAMTYLDDVAGDHNDTPGATRAPRLTDVEQAPRMIDFLVE